jgi:hypothetical protein
LLPHRNETFDPAAFDHVQERGAISRAILRNCFCTRPEAKFLFQSKKSDAILKFWIFALSAVAAIAARATYQYVNRPPRSGRFINDQVSSDWLATARIHEDQG